MKNLSWRVAQVGLVLLCFGLVTSVRAQDAPTHVDEFQLSWSQMVGLLGFVGVLFGGAAELRRWMMDLDRRVQRIEDKLDKEGV